MSPNTESLIKKRLETISAVALQKLAEDMASVKFPQRFGRSVLRRAGRNADDQTTKGWPDAYVITGSNEVDGIEATRRKVSWKEHLKADLNNAKSDEYRNLSGYFFVGGCPKRSPPTAEIDAWTERFAEIGIDPLKISILVGDDLVFELCKPEYAALRQVHLGVHATPDWFRLLGDVTLTERGLGLFQPTQGEFEAGVVGAPSILEAVVDDLISTGNVLVRGRGAAGKTTLAELVSRHDRIAPNAVWYLDFARFDDDVSEANALNEMMELGGGDVVFIFDNVHLDATLAGQIHKKWSDHLSPIGARLLLLGRYTQGDSGFEGATISVHELRAGIPEMMAVVARLSNRRELQVPHISQAIWENWAETFGGSRKPELTAVDLIAFTAALDRRLDQLAAVGFSLSPADAVDAVRIRYLDPLREHNELENILRLAAFSEFELPLSDHQLARPTFGLRESINRLGLVIQVYHGVERRRYYRLVHAGIGRLLLQTTAPEFDPNSERIRAVGENPVLGRRISPLLKSSTDRDIEAEEIDVAVRLALSDPAWPKNIENFYELGGLARYAQSSDTMPSVEIDTAIAKCGSVARLLGRGPSISALLQFLSVCRMVELPKSSAAVASAVARSPWREQLTTLRASDLANLIRISPNPKQLLTSIDAARWNEGQASGPSELAADTLSACLFFERRGRPELSKAPALRQIDRAAPALWFDQDLSHLSHLLRIAQPPVTMAKTLIDALSSSGWLARTFSNGILGHLCGSLMSLANYLDPSLRKLFLTDELAMRVESELAIAPSAREKRVSRGICLLGGYVALGGLVPLDVNCTWSAGDDAGSLLAEVAHTSEDFVGMYELQLWFGLKALDLVGQGPKRFPMARGDSFLKRLQSSAAPTPQAETLRISMIDWLHTRQKDNWVASAP